MTRLTLDISPETEKKLDEIAAKKHITKAEAIRRAFAILAIADEQEDQGNMLALVNKTNNQLVGRLVGV